MKTNLILIFLLCFSLQLSAQAQLVFSKQKLVADFEFLYTSLEENHPDLFLHSSEIDYEKHKAKVLNSIQDSMFVQDFYLLIAPFVALLQDGHTRVNVPRANRMQFMNDGGLAFPLRVKVADERLFVALDLSAEQIVPVGAEILSINEIPVAEILRQMFSLKGAEVSNDINFQTISNYFSTLLWFLYRFENDYQLMISENGNKKHIHLLGITQAHFMEIMSQQPPQNNISFYDFRIDSLKNTAFLEIRGFHDIDGLTEFLEKSFYELSFHNVDSLIIDVRNNGGGSSISVDSLMNFLTDKPYKQFSKIKLKVNELTRARYRERNPFIYNVIKNLPNGAVFTMYDIPYTVPREKSTMFSGKVTVYVNAKTYSAASTFASLIECLQRGTVVGQTGSLEYLFGNMLQFKLPNTQIEYLIPINMFFNWCFYKE